MPRIKDEDIQLVRERARIDEVVESYVTLRNAGGGARKGLCPFHDEKSPSFNVRPAQGYYHCFGCGVGGDSIKFLMEIEGLPFAEAVERPCLCPNPSLSSLTLGSLTLPLTGGCGTPVAPSRKASCWALRKPLTLTLTLTLTHHVGLLFTQTAASNIDPHPNPKCNPNPKP